MRAIPKSLRMLSILALVGLVVAGLRADVRAATSGVTELRAELARVRAAQGRNLPEGAWLSIAYTLDVAERIERDFAAQAEVWRRRAQGFLEHASQGRDPLLEQRGKLVMRGYRSAVSEHLQGYGVYLPPGYDGKRSYPLLVMLHGGSANGNLFLGVVLGNNMNWKQYPIHLWDDFAPRFTPELVVVAPDGFGQVMWRFMGEQDVLDVVADVQKHYRIDEDRIVLGGLSNGGVGAYNLGLRHASKWSMVQAIAGAPSWLQYAGGKPPAEQRVVMEAQSGMQLLENAHNTDFRYYHGRTDGGPMKPRFVEELGALARKLAVPFTERWYDAGHDLLYLVHRHGRVYDELAQVRRKKTPSEVHLVTGDYRAARQHWVEVTRISRYPELARVHAKVEASGARISMTTENVGALALDLQQAPVIASGELAVVIDGAQVWKGPRAQVGARLEVVRGATGFMRDTPKPTYCSQGSPPRDVFEKGPGSSGPITDAYYGAMLHVYGTGDAASTAALKKSAERGAKGWPLWLWRVQQKVVADTEVTPEQMRSHNLVLYATPGSHRVLEQIASKLPVQVTKDGVVLAGRRFTGKGVGVKLIHPNPLAPDRYVLVQAGPTLAGVDGGHQLPDFLPDYVVYDARTTATRPRLVFERGRMPLAMGYFDRHWKLTEPAPEPLPQGGDEVPPQGARPGRSHELEGGRGRGSEATLAGGGAPDGFLSTPSHPGGSRDPPLEQPPPPPEPVTEFAASPRTQAGQAARLIAKLVPTFTNYRSRIPRSSWLVHPTARWSIRDNEQCLAELRKAGVPFALHEAPLPTPVPTPVDVTGPVDGVSFRMVHKGRTLLMSCELALRLPDLAAALRPHGVDRVAVISAYRDTPRSSFHTLGLALDVWRFFTPDSVLSVLRDFEHTPQDETCKAPSAKTEAARTLREIACKLGGTLRFSSVLTPNYNEGHKDHFHFDIRPEDPRVFVR